MRCSSRWRFLPDLAGAERRIFLYRGANNAYLLELETAHFAVMLSQSRYIQPDDSSLAYRW